MEGFCCTLLSMSLAAALTALGVMVARLFLYKGHRLPRPPAGRRRGGKPHPPRKTPPAKRPLRRPPIGL